VTLGGILAEARQAKGVTLEQAASATRVRLHVLTALEEDRAAELPAPVYARGYLRTYASYLEIDPERLLEAYEASRTRQSGSLAIRPLSSLTASPNLVLTAPAAGAVGLVLLVFAFTGYVYKELDSVRTPPPAPRVAATALATPTASPSPSPLAPTPAAAVATVQVSVTDTVWIDVAVDGKPQFADAGRILQPGATLSFSGSRVKVTTGKGVATLISVNGRDFGAMGNGVITREYTAQT
jgi:transcriptional regulator with XRE-family HTH domain